MKNIKLCIKIITVVNIVIILCTHFTYSLSDKKYILGGDLLEINMNTRGIMYHSVYDNEKFKNFDIINCMSSNCIQELFGEYNIYDISKKDLLNIILTIEDDELIKANITREGKERTLYLSKKDLKEGYFTDKILFSASLTFINQENNTYNALAHNVDEEIENVIKKEGNISSSTLSSIMKSSKNRLGNISGNINFEMKGNISSVSDFGIKGKIYSRNKHINNQKLYEIADTHEVHEGNAKLVINHGEQKYYDIKVYKVNNQYKKDVHGFEFEVVDEELINQYGGLTQGMSGCPIIQNGKIIGALSHVFLNNTKLGVGIYAKWLIEKG